MVPPSASGKGGDSLRSLHLHAGTRPLLQSVRPVDHTIMVAGAIMKGIVIGNNMILFVFYAYDLFFWGWGEVDDKVSWSLTFFLLIADFQATEVIQIVHHIGDTGALQGGDPQGSLSLHFPSFGFECL